MRSAINHIFIVMTFALCVFYSHSTTFAKDKKQTLIKEKKKDVDKIKKELLQKKNLIKELKSKETSILSVVDDIASSIYKNKEKLKSADTNKKTVTREIDKLKENIKGLDKEIKQKRKEIKVSIQSSYRSGKTGFLEMLLASENFSDFQKRKYYLEKIIETENRLLSAYVEKEKSLIKSMETLENKKNEFDVLSLEIKDRLKKIKNEREKKVAVLKALRSEKDLEIKKANELERAAKNLEKMIMQIKKSSSNDGTDFLIEKGQLSYPVRGSLSAKFGKYHDKTLNVFLYSKGIRIKAQEGASVKAIFEGKVIYAGYFSGYGNMLIVDHGGNYYSLYAGLDSISKGLGTKIKRSDEIGKVSAESSIREGLYFELRHNGIAIDPLPWFE